MRRTSCIAAVLIVFAGCVGRIQDARNVGEDGSAVDDVTIADPDTGTDARPADSNVPLDAATDRYVAPSDTNNCVPGVEVCNGRDDDCDGAIDEDLGASNCGTGACARMQLNCMNGATQTCTPGAPAAESCNGIDDDCDGMVDDGLAPRAFCGSACVDTSNDEANCGACGRACASGQTCTAGACSMTGGTTPMMLQLVNTARATARMCGTTAYPAVPPLTWDTRLEAAALAHSTDMATNNFFSHTGSDGSSPSQRVTRAGYSWSATGENIAAGQPTETDAMDSWIASPGHCANIMSRNYTQLGAALARGGSYGTYWTQEFGRP